MENEGNIGMPDFASVLDAMPPSTLRPRNLKTQQSSVSLNFNLVPRAHVPFGQHQDTELWNNQFPETKILGLPVSGRMRGLVYMASRDKVDVYTFHKGIQYALEKLEKSKFGFERTAVSNFKSKRHEGSGNELVDYSRVPCLGADKKARGLWERDCLNLCLRKTRSGNSRDYRDVIVF